MLSGERKKFALRSARKPIIVDGMSNTVIVYEDGQAHFCYILFDPCFVSTVGKKMPRGVNLSEPAFVQVMFDSTLAKWVVSACYVNGWQQVKLWESETRPHWLKELKPIRHIENDNLTPHTPRSAATSRNQHPATATT